ncbi:ABC transporter substrate-binding protein, partial [Lysobacter sp. 2RAB21]
MTAPAAASDRPLRLGYLPLVDCAPLVAAVRLGLDRRHGLRLQLQRQASWAAVRDRLLSGELDAAHALAGLV